jgi:sulfur-oxidizing protein SoxY
MKLSRRETLAAGAAFLVATIVDAPAWALPADAEAEIAKFTGGKPAQDGPISIDLPEIAENGNTVPLAIVVDHPMTAESYVSDILVVSDGNPRPGFATFHLSQMSGRAEAATRVRLNTTQNVIVVAKTSDGKLLTARKLVKVTIGGCGG